MSTDSKGPAFPLTRKRTYLAALLFRLWWALKTWWSADRPGYAKNSAHPPWGWPITLIIALALLGVLFYGPVWAARLIGV